MAGFHFPYDISSTLEPWRHELGQNFDHVVATLSDRDRALEDYLYPGQAWTQYTPASNNVTVGNGTEAAFFSRAGRLLVVKYELTWGSTTAFGGTVAVGVPTVSANNGAGSMGSVLMFHSGTTTFFPGAWSLAANASVGSILHAVPALANGGRINATVPFTWATGDILRMTITYEPAI